jgi:hypothetical protein
MLIFFTKDQEEIPLKLTVLPFNRGENVFEFTEVNTQIVLAEKK